jgi:predicted PurR-regulated permease PerM
VPAGLANLRAHFDAYDLTQTGDLSAVEIDRLLTSIGLGLQTRNEVHRALADADASTDTSVSFADGVTFDELVQWMNSTIEAHFDESKQTNLSPEDVLKLDAMQKSVRKVGYAGTSWRSFQNTIWILTQAVTIMCASTIFVGIVYFRFILVPMTMAYFMTFLLGPLVDVMAQRPLICFGRVFCKVNKLPRAEAAKVWDQRYKGRRMLPPMEHLEYPYDEDGQVCCHARPPAQGGLADAAATTVHQWLTVGKLPFPLALGLTLVFTGFSFRFAALLISRDIQEVLTDATFMDEFEELLVAIVVRFKNEMGIVITEFDPVSIRKQLEGNKTCVFNNDPGTDVLEVMVPVGNGTECIQVQEFSSEEFQQLVAPYLVVANDVILTFLLCLYLLAARTMRGEFDHNRVMHAAGRLTIVEKIEMMNRNYVQLKTKLSAFTAGCVMIVLFACRIKLWFIWGALTFSLNFIPNVGSLIAMVLPVPIILVDQQLGLVRQTAAILLPAIIQAYVGNVLEPQMFGKSLNLTAISVLIGLVFWSAIWGMAGAVLSVPLLGVMKILLDAADYPLAKQMLNLIREDNTLDEEGMTRAMIKELSGYQQEHAFAISTENPNYKEEEATV